VYGDIYIDEIRSILHVRALVHVMYAGVNWSTVLVDSLARLKGEGGEGRGRLSHVVHAAEAWCTMSTISLVVVLLVQAIVRPAYTQALYMPRRVSACWRPVAACLVLQHRLCCRAFL